MTNNTYHGPAKEVGPLLSITHVTLHVNCSLRASLKCDLKKGVTGCRGRGRLSRAESVELDHKTPHQNICTRLIERNHDTVALNSQW